MKVHCTFMKLQDGDVYFHEITVSWNYNFRNPGQRDSGKATKSLGRMASAGQQELTRAIPEAAANLRLVRAHVLPTHQAMGASRRLRSPQLYEGIVSAFCLGRMLLAQSGKADDLRSSPRGEWKQSGRPGEHFCRCPHRYRAFRAIRHHGDNGEEQYLFSSPWRSEWLES